MGSGRRRLICGNCGAPAAGIQKCPAAPYALNPPYCNTLEARVSDKGAEVKEGDLWIPLPEDLRKTIKQKREQK